MENMMRLNQKGAALVAQRFPAATGLASIAGTRPNDGTGQSNFRS
ncbi:MAG: hypothetical protein ACTHKB_14340 [Burkholderiaceae bacterium]